MVETIIREIVRYRREHPGKHPPWENSFRDQVARAYVQLCARCSLTRGHRLTFPENRPLSLDRIPRPRLPTALRRNRPAPGHSPFEPSARPPDIPAPPVIRASPESIAAGHVKLKALADAYVRHHKRKVDRIAERFEESRSGWGSFGACEERSMQLADWCMAEELKQQAYDLETIQMFEEELDRDGLGTDNLSRIETDVGKYMDELQSAARR